MRDGAYIRITCLFDLLLKGVKSEILFAGLKFNEAIFDLPKIITKKHINTSAIGYPRDKEPIAAVRCTHKRQSIQVHESK
jgi:hypothetical protein